jgi:hypothetical protein
MADTYQNILELLKQVIDSHPDTVWHTGEDFNDVADDVKAMASLAVKHGGEDVRLRLITPEAAEAFEWTGELTFIPPQKPQLRHFLLLRDGSIVEAYGKHLLDVDPSDATALLLRLQMLQDEL